MLFHDDEQYLNSMALLSARRNSDCEGRIVVNRSRSEIVPMLTMQAGTHLSEGPLSNYPN